MYIKENRNMIIGKQKIVANFKKYYWIFILSIFIGCLVVIGMNLKNSMEPPQVTTSSSMRLVWDEHAYGEDDLNLKLEQDNQSDTYVKLLLAEYESYINTNKFQRMLQEDYMQEFGTQRKVFLDTLKMESAGYIVKFQISGNEKKENVFLLQYVSEQFLKYVEESTDLKGEVLDSAEDEASTIVVENSFNISGLVSVKSIFIVILFAMLGLAIILVLVLFDERIRTRAEMKELYCIPYIGTIGAKTYEEDMERIYGVVRYYCRKYTKDACAIVGTGEFKMFDKIKKAFSDEEKNGSVLFLESSLMLGKMAISHENPKDVILLVNVGEDRVKDIDYIVELCEKMEIGVLGFVLCEKLK